MCLSGVWSGREEGGGREGDEPDHVPGPDHGPAGTQRRWQDDHHLDAHRSVLGQPRIEQFIVFIVCFAVCSYLLIYCIQLKKSLKCQNYVIVTLLHKLN